MRAALLALLLCGCGDLTQVLVSVDSVDLSIPSQVAKVRITASTTDGGTIYTSPDLPLCATGMTTGCFSFPITATLVPGSRDPSDTVRVEVDALDGNGTIVISDATSFVFTSGTKQRVDFFLSSNCLGVTCAKQGLSCEAGACVSASMTGAADMSVPQPITRVSFTALLTMSGVVQPPSAQAGDVVLYLIDAHGQGNLGPTPPAGQGWRSLGGLGPGEYIALYGRFAGVNESTNAAAYTFTPVAPMGPVPSAIAVYRGARAFAPGVSSDGTNPNPLPSVPVSDGALVVGILDNIYLSKCTGTAGTHDIVEQSSFILVDAGPFSAGQSPAQTITCANDDANSIGSFFEVVLSR